MGPHNSKPLANLDMRGYGHFDAPAEGNTRHLRTAVCSRGFLKRFEVSCPRIAQIGSAVTNAIDPAAMLVPGGKRR
jgi:hypothetical protein